MRRVDSDRREHGEDVAEEMILEPGALRLGQLLGLKHMDACIGKQRFEPDPGLLLLVGQLGDEAGDAVELLGRGQSVPAPSRTLRLKCSQESSRLKNRLGPNAAMPAFASSGCTCSGKVMNNLVNF